MRDWAGKRYWVIGASEGLGAALARKLSACGATVLLSARNQGRLEELAETLSGLSEIIPMDVCDMASVTAGFEAAGHVDGIVYAAGLYWPMSAQNWNSEQALAMVDANLLGAYRVLGHVVPQMTARDGGHIILIGSLAAYGGLPGSIGYSNSKAGLMSLAESLECDLRHTNVSVQLINPGYIRTRLTDKNDFSMPQILDADDAARICVEHMQSDRFQKVFPAPFSWLFRLARFLPSSLYFRLFG